MHNKKDIVDRLMLKSPLHNLTSYELVEAANEITRLRKERDEARREVCQWEHHWDKTSSEQYYADKRGWDCFKENT
jgi:hypothetical protein